MYMDAGPHDWEDSSLVKYMKDYHDVTFSGWINRTIVELVTRELKARNIPFFFI